MDVYLQPKLLIFDGNFLHTVINILVFKWDKYTMESSETSEFSEFSETSEYSEKAALLYIIRYARTHTL